jgi:hypothetical protein
MYLGRTERSFRAKERKVKRRRERRQRYMQKYVRRDGREWEVHFVPGDPTVWAAGARPRTYGEPKMRLSRK